MNETLYVWAFKNQYRTLSEDSPEFHFIVKTTEGRPYQDGAFLVHQHNMILRFDMPEDTIAPQVYALRAAQTEARVEAEMVAKEYEDKIQALLALPAPE